MSGGEARVWRVVMAVLVVASTLDALWWASNESPVGWLVGVIAGVAAANQAGRLHTYIRDLAASERQP